MNHPVKTCQFEWACYPRQLVTHYQTQNYEQNHFHKRLILHVPTLGKIYYFYKEYQPLFKEIKDKIEGIEFLPCLV